MSLLLKIVYLSTAYYLTTALFLILSFTSASISQSQLWSEYIKLKLACFTYLLRIKWQNPFSQLRHGKFMGEETQQRENERKSH